MLNICIYNFEMIVFKMIRTFTFIANAKFKEIFSLPDHDPKWGPCRRNVAEPNYESHESSILKSLIG